MDMRVVMNKEAGRPGLGMKTPFSGARDYWEKRALESGEYGVGESQAERLLSIMEVKSDWSVLDMWCSRRLALPLARRARSVTAIEYSVPACNALSESCRAGGIRNVIPVFGRWDDDAACLCLGAYDVIIASWPALMSHAPQSIVQLNRAARRGAYIFTTVGDGIFDRRLYGATGRTLELGPSYLDVYYDLVHAHLGILANLVFIHEKRRNEWAGPEEALDAQRWMFGGLTGEEERKVKAFLHEHLQEKDGRWQLDYERECQWAVIWWTKQGAREGRSGRPGKARTPDAIGRLRRQP